MAANSGNVHHGFDTYKDVTTGKTYTYDGEEVEQPAANVAGNLADLQRGGALVAAGVGTMDDGVVLEGADVTQEEARQGVVESAQAGEPVHPKAESLINRKGDEITAAGDSKSKK